MDAGKLVTFFELLRQGYTVAQLATAVEKHGATGWDRYGRYGSFLPASEGARSALDALADYGRSEDDFFERVEAEVSRYPDEPCYPGRFIDELDTQTSLEIHRLGLNEGAVSLIDRSVINPAPPRRPQSVPRTSAMLNILGAILAYIEDSRRRDRRILMPTQAALIDWMCASHAAADGVSKSNLEKQVALARAAISDTSRK